MKLWKFSSFYFNLDRLSCPVQVSKETATLTWKETDRALHALLASLEERESSPRPGPRPDRGSQNKERGRPQEQGESQEQGRSRKRRSQDATDDKDGAKKSKYEPEVCKRPDFSLRYWRPGEIRIVNADGISIIPKLDWAAIEFKVMEAVADLTEELHQKSNLPHCNLGSPKLYYDRELKCGILEIKDIDRLVLTRNLLANSIRDFPRLQLLTKYDRLTPIVTTFAPRVYNGLTDAQSCRLSRVSPNPTVQSPLCHPHFQWSYF